MYPSLLSHPSALADFDTLQRQLDWLFGPRGPSSSIRAVERGSFPAVNVGVTPEAMDVFAFVPGVEPSSLEVSVDKGLLTIAGERRADEQAQGEPRTVYARERAGGSFRRVISLNDDADPDQVSATCGNGILHVRVAKQASSRPRRIEIQDAQETSAKLQQQQQQPQLMKGAAA
jgi:HSP20 family protein